MTTNSIARSITPSLAAFNVGVELGQLAIVALVLPVADAERGPRLHQRFVMIGGSLAVAAIAVIWLLERVFSLALLPGPGT